MDLFDTLKVSLESGTPPTNALDKPVTNVGLDYAVWRFLYAWQGTGTISSDHAVLMRQIARWQRTHEKLFFAQIPERLEALFHKVQVFRSGDGVLSAIPFVPEWLKGDHFDRMEGVDPPPTFRRCKEELPAETFLNALGYSAWQSLAQKEAVWFALNAPPTSTSLIALPTGCGKSLCFQLLAKYCTGVTLVIVPTVALAIDQFYNSKKVLAGSGDINPLYFAADDPVFKPDIVMEHLRSNHTRLIFASPEACVSGRLRNILEELIRSGRLENLVIDEAHLIEIWGINFRVDFQMLSSLQKKWMEYPGSRLRTYLLSATFTPACRTLLKELFEVRNGWRECISQRLRPEMTYYCKAFDSESQRQDAVRDCVWLLPRPAILYTTEVKDAIRWATTLAHEDGFSRIGCFHGDTPSSERRLLLHKWRTDAIDLIVATSAFGLGVDKSDVRSIIHACLPENLNRYYQEVGRGGRDGATTICILLTTKRDTKVAERLTPTLLGKDLIQKRWAALWETRQPTQDGPYVWELNAESRRLALLGTRTWSENIRWNKRLILQLLRAKMLELLDVTYRPTVAEPGVADSEYDDKLTEWIKVKIRFSPESPEVGKNLAEQRRLELENAQSGLSQMKAHVRGENCIATLLKRIYGYGTQRICGGCQYCRDAGRLPASCPQLELQPPLVYTVHHRIIANCPNPLDRSAIFRFNNLIRNIISSKHIVRFACEEHLHSQLLPVVGNAIESLVPYRIDLVDDERSFRVLDSEALAILHVGTVSKIALSFSGARDVYHLISADVPYIDENGRFPLEGAGAVFYQSPETWLQEG